MISKILEDRFNEYKKDIPEFIEENDSYYGSYIIRPVLFISRDYYYDGMSKEEFRKIQKLMIDANTEFREIINYWKIKEIKSKSETYIVYTADKNDNKDWLEKNKDCGYLKVMNERGREYKGGVPLAVDTDKLFHNYWQKYPFTKIN